MLKHKMSREEAIQCLKTVEVLGFDETVDRIQEALKMAIEALSTDIIRCKDCAYSEIDDPDFPNQYFCKYHGLAWNDGEHFCSDGYLPEIMTPHQGETDEKEK